jgi:DUF1009 family protein
MCGAGALPARMAAEARRQGWRVVAFAFADAAAVGPYADRLVRSCITEIGPVLDDLRQHAIPAVLFSGRFSHADVLTGRHDATLARIAQRAGSLVDSRLLRSLERMFAEMGVELLDQRKFLGEGLEPEGCLTERAPSSDEWLDIRAGMKTARMIADAHIGQAVVVKRGAVVAVEASEGTTEAIRRGTALAGAGAVVAKAAARDHDYRFDIPTVGPDTVAAVATGQGTAIAIEASRVFVADREATAACARTAGITLVSVASGAD